MTYRVDYSTTKNCSYNITFIIPVKTYKTPPPLLYENILSTKLTVNIIQLNIILNTISHTLTINTVIRRWKHRFYSITLRGVEQASIGFRDGIIILLKIKTIYTHVKILESEMFLTAVITINTEINYHSTGSKVQEYVCFSNGMTR